MNLTDKQLIHRAYLGSPLWAEKRLEALRFHGAICARCGSHGTDVHHKTYERTGGSELMSDLEVLCRPCHETHHRVERAVRGHVKSKKRGINVTALARYLTGNHRAALQRKYGIAWPQIYAALITLGNPRLTRDALDMVGRDYAYQHTRRGAAHSVGSWVDQKHHAKLMA